MADHLSQSEDATDNEQSDVEQETTEDNMEASLSQSEDATDNEQSDVEPETTEDNMEDSLSQSDDAIDNEQSDVEQETEDIMEDPLSQSEGATDDQPSDDQPETTEDNMAENENDKSTNKRGKTAPPARKVPPELKSLNQMSEIFVRQKVECLEIFTDIETRNRYKIKDKKKNTIYTVKEKSNCCIRNMFGSARSYEMRIKEDDKEIIRLKKPMLCCGQELEVQAPPENTIGYVKKKRCSCCIPGAIIMDKGKKVYLNVHGPCLIFEFCRDIKFKALKADGKPKTDGNPEIITKQPRGFMKTCFTHASKYHIKFPNGYDAEQKATLLGACIFIDVVYFGNSGKLFSKIVRFLRHLTGMFS